jgi:polyphosphate kinase
VISIVGRFLEHARIYYFQNAGQEEYFIGSADAMKRNLEHRVESLVSVENRSLCEQLKNIFELQLNDRGCAWELQRDGSYQKLAAADGSAGECSQERLVRQAEKRLHEVQRLRKRKAKNAAPTLSVDH